MLKTRIITALGILPVVFILWVVLMVVAAVRTGNGEEYKYPLTIRLLQ